MLYHFSEDANIGVFIPKEKQNRPDFPAVVWAIDEEHEFTYYFPRDCPRIICRKTEDISDKNVDLFFRNTNADMIVTVESGWYSRIIEKPYTNTILKMMALNYLTRQQGIISLIR